MYDYEILHNLAICDLSIMSERSVRSVRILVTSSKGGIGKSTISLGLALAFAGIGRRVLLCDCDLGGRCLDLLMGVENHVLFDIGDVAAGRTVPAKALLNPWDIPNLFFCPSPAFLNHEDVADGKLARALSALEAECEADHVICDTAGMMWAPDIAAGFADTALVISTQQPASVRAAEACSIALDDKGLSDSRLIISMFEWKAAEKGSRAGIIDIIDGAGMRCAGVVPFDRTLMLAGESGRRPSKSVAAKAFENIAARLEGDSVKLFSGMPGISGKKSL